MKIGILTFHRAYNYGAVIQAYCLQKILDKLNAEAEVIDYLLNKQIKYTSLYSFRHGYKSVLKNLILLTLHKKRVARKLKFDNFVRKLKISKIKYENLNDLESSNNNYDAIVVGSDQVWNVKKKEEVSDAYFLSFANDKIYKFSYAASIGLSTKVDLNSKKGYLSRFNQISCREKGGSQILYELLNKSVDTVLDPTLLIDSEELNKIAANIQLKNYLFYYTLDGFDKRNNNKKIIIEIAKKFDLNVFILAPEWPFHSYGHNLVDVGPEEFLGLIKNANLVCTNSFHGTALSIKFNTPFYVLESKDDKDERKRNILSQLDLENRILPSINSLCKLSNYKLDYKQTNSKLKELRVNSFRFLKKCIGEIKCN